MCRSQHRARPAHHHDECACGSRPEQVLACRQRRAQPPVPAYLGARPLRTSHAQQDEDWNNAGDYWTARHTKGHKHCTHKEEGGGGTSAHEILGVLTTSC